ncbi:MAG: hypothetical protein IT445_20740 [Phycisphaeraceae bacterium]|nr:hypothetical protein [Phycisphaeraceae bacterium]
MKQIARQDRRRCGGFFVLDALVAIGLLLLMSAMIGLALSKTAQAERVLADRRAAQRLAEQVMLHEQMGLTTPEDERVHIEKLPLTEDGSQWITVRVSLGQATFELTGLLPQRLSLNPLSPWERVGVRAEHSMAASSSNASATPPSPCPLPRGEGSEMALKEVGSRP